MEHYSPGTDVGRLSRRNCLSILNMSNTVLTASLKVSFQTGSGWFLIVLVFHSCCWLAAAPSKVISTNGSGLPDRSDFFRFYSK